MRKFAAIFLSLIFSGAGLYAKTTAQEAPQTARQALMEMFFSKEPGTFLRHLPAVTRAALDKSGALASMQQYSIFAAQMQSQGKTLQTFEAGSVLLVTADPKTGQKVEVVVENDSLRGDQDDIEISFHTYKENQPQRTPFMPRIVFSMKMESGLWTLNDIAITINLPLADPDLLKSFSDKMTGNGAPNSQVHVQAVPIQSMGQAPQQVPVHPFSSDTIALAAVRKIVAAETTYAATYPAVGYTCTLSDLDGFGAAEANAHQAMLISSGLASGKHQGYNFSLSQCTGMPANSFRLTATPIGEAYGRRTFCSDQSGTIRASSDGGAASCLSSGAPIP